MKEIADSRIADTKVIDEKVKEVLDKVNDLPYINSDGVEETDKEDKTILSLLNEALEQYAQGDDTELQKLANQSIEVEDTPDDGEEETNESEEGVETSDDSDGEDNEGAEGNDPLTVQDAAKFARSVLEGSVDNKLLDSYTKLIPALKKIQF